MTKIIEIIKTHVRNLTKCDDFLIQWKLENILLDFVLKLAEKNMLIHIEYTTKPF